MDDEDRSIRVNTSKRVGDYQKTIEYHGKQLQIAREMGDQGGEGAAYGNLGNAYQSLDDYQKAMEYHEKDLKIAKEVGDQGVEGAAYKSLGNAYRSLSDYQKSSCRPCLTRCQWS